MAEELSDWKVHVTLDKEAIVGDIMKLARILARERLSYTVSASSRDEAIGKTREYVWKLIGIYEYYVRSYSPRRLPT